MKEQTQTTILGILKLIPFAIVTAIIVLFWVDDFIGFMIALIFCWVTLPAIGFSIAFFIKGLRWSGGDGMMPAGTELTVIGVEGNYNADEDYPDRFPHRPRGSLLLKSFPQSS